jgi:hypothetical protein
MTRSAPHDPAGHGRENYGRASDAWLGQLSAAAHDDPDAWLGDLRAAAGDEPAAPLPPRRRPARRVAATGALVTLFALGAAFTAAAGDRVAGAVADEDGGALLASAGDVSSAIDETTTTDSTTTSEPAATDSVPGGDTAPPAETTTAPPSEEPAIAAPADDGDALGRTPVAPTRAPAAAAAAPAPQATRVARRAATAPTPVARIRRETAQPVVAPVPPTHRVNQLEAEAQGQAGATVWLHTVLPDPTPPSRRLTPAFAKQLRAAAKREHVDWALLLGILRAQGHVESVPATADELDGLARALARAKTQGSAPVLSVTGDTARADQAVAIAHLSRFVGLATLVHGFEWAKPRLGERLLHDKRVTIYDGGRGDIEAGRIDVRVLALIGFLADTYGGVSVSCLESGHRLYARPGVVSAHIYGLAVDIAAVGDTSILGHQAPGGITEETVRSILLLPSELRPRQVISLLGLGGPSFAQADHYNHIHVGF